MTAATSAEYLQGEQQLISNNTEPLHWRRLDIVTRKNTHCSCERDILKYQEWFRT